MAGTSINVLLKEKVTTSQRVEFVNLLSEISSYITGQDDVWNLSINNISEIEANYKNNERCFHVCIESKIPDLRAIHTKGKQYWGWDSAEVINIATCSNEFIDQRLLCLLAIKFANLYNGLIHMGGTVHSKNISNCCYNFSKIIKKRIRNFIKTINLPGKIFELPSYGDDDEFIVHVVDPEYLTAWLLHPDFHMLKFPKQYLCQGASRKLSVASYEGNSVVEKGEILGH